jgi:hypothetical protein
MREKMAMQETEQRENAKEALDKRTWRRESGPAQQRQNEKKGR